MGSYGLVGLFTFGLRFPFVVFSYLVCWFGALVGWLVVQYPSHRSVWVDAWEIEKSKSNEPKEFSE